MCRAGIPPQAAIASTARTDLWAALWNWQGEYQGLKEDAAPLQEQIVPGPSRSCRYSYHCPRKKAFSNPSIPKSQTDSMKQLNKVGERFGQLPYIQAMTDCDRLWFAWSFIRKCAKPAMRVAVIHFEQVPSSVVILSIYLENNCVREAPPKWES